MEIFNRAVRRNAISNWTRWTSAQVIASMVFALPWVTHQSLAAANPSPLGYVMPGFEAPARAPYLLNWVRPNLLAVVDPVAGDLVFLNEMGQIVDRQQFPASFVPDSRSNDGGSIVFMNADRSVAWMLTSDMRFEEVSGKLSIGQTPWFSDFESRSSAEKSLHLAKFPAETGQVKASRGFSVLDAEVLGSDACGSTYVRLDEVAIQNDERVAITSVARIDQAGSETGRTVIAIDDQATLGRGAIDVSLKGDVWSVQSGIEGVKLRRTSIEGRSGAGACKPNKSAGPADGAAERGSVALQRMVPSEAEPVYDDAAVMGPADGQRVRIRPGREIHRSEILERAESYTRLNWTLGAANWQHTGIDSVCQPATGHYWRRPRKFSSEAISKSFSNVPYRWGGSDSPEQFLKNMVRGKLAGDVCTCRSEKFGNCLVQESAGVDCSGLVSFAWGISKIGTAQFDDIAETIADWKSAKPGDAFVRPNKHIVLVKAVVPGPVLSFRTIESTTDVACQGVCERVQGASVFLQGYHLVRYKSAVD